MTVKIVQLRRLHRGNVAMMSWFDNVWFCPWHTVGTVQGKGQIKIKKFSFPGETQRSEGSWWLGVRE
jgi:hypothetical protein